MSTWEEKWIEDIDYLKDSLIRKHANLFANITKEEFNHNIETLKNIVNELDYEEMKVEISKIVASVKDAHTAVIFPSKRYIPLKFYWFEEGIYIINTTEKYKDLLFKKVIAIENIKIEKVIDELSEVISYENQYLFKAQSMKYLQVAEVLYGLMIIDEVNRVKITVENDEFSIETVSISELVYMELDLPIYAENAGENYWHRYLEYRHELYIKYNACRESGKITIKHKIEESIRFIETNKIHKVTIDLRNNLGGDSRLINPLIEYLKSSSTINTKNNLKVIIGRETFSSALLNAYELKFKTNGRIVGEPSGGKPNCYGEILKFTLPNSKLMVSYSTKYYKLIEDDEVMALYPDELILESIEDYIKGYVSK